jgi:alpha-galactosidase
MSSILNLVASNSMQTNTVGLPHFLNPKGRFFKMALASLQLVLCLFGATTAFPQDAATWSHSANEIIARFGKGKMPPFSFVYGGKNSKTFITKWKYKTDKPVTSSDRITTYIFTYTEPRQGLVVKCTLKHFQQFNVTEWRLDITNDGQLDSPIVEKVNVVDQLVGSEPKGKHLVHYGLGGDVTKGDFAAIDSMLQKGKNIYLAPAGGRSSDRTAMPFFNIEMPGNKGIMTAVGWTGKWFADIQLNESGGLTLKSGMERMRLKLMPGEKIRTPVVSLLFWAGADRMVGHNRFRQFVLAHHSRKINGKFAEYPLSGGFNWGDPPPCNEYSCLTEDYAVSLIKRYRQFKIVPEVFWLDAGWYTGCGTGENGQWWENVGNWTVDKVRFPNGLKPIADAVHEAGAKFMVWFEPERVHKGTQLEKEHPEFLLTLEGKGDYLFNLGDPSARLWMTDYISDYRQDFNMDPMPFWQKADQPDRTGISEIRHIEGLYAYWDSLLVRFPNLLIDNCASGGRRLDLETTSRSAPLWRTDYHYGEPNGYQNHTYGLHFYLPLHGTGLFAKADPFTFRSSLSSAMVLNWKITGNQVSIPDMQRSVADFKRLRPYYYGDYYPLTPPENNTTEQVWLAYQMHRPDAGDGIIVAFRRSENQQEVILVEPKGLDPVASYEWWNEDSGEKKILSGEVFLKGVSIRVKSMPGSALISYRKVN